MTICSALNLDDKREGDIKEPLGKKLGDFLAKIGMGINTCGLWYVRDIILMVLAQIKSKIVMRSLYERISITNAVSVESVEKAIRNAVSIAKNGAAFDNFYEILKIDKQDVPPEKITNSKFVAIVADRIRLGIL